MGLIEDAKEAVKLVQQIGNVELYRKILDLQAEALELMEQLREKDETIKKLQSAFELKGKLVCEHSSYYLVDERGEKVDGPFCCNCFDTAQLKSRLVAVAPRGVARDRVMCPKCRVDFSSINTARYIRRQ